MDPEIVDKWRGRLRPFLAKAVALDESASGTFLGFCARLFGDALLISHASEGDHLLSMKNVPVVIFLARKPSNVYRDVSMLLVTQATPPPDAGCPVRAEDEMQVTIEP